MVTHDKKTSIELNEQFKKALQIMENSSRSVFITGRAGTGKSTLLNYFRSLTRKKTVFLAPTGVAALNIKGQTIHSFFHFKPSISLSGIRKLQYEGNTIYQKLETIVIDEISMVRADLLDCVDRFLRLNRAEYDLPFGGVQMIFIGDLYQLPPVVSSAEKEIFNSLYKTPYFYSANVFRSFQMDFLELEKIYRQHDRQFIDLLNSIRSRNIDDNLLALLNSRVRPDFVPSAGDHYIYLTTTNDMATGINEEQILTLPGDVYTFTGIIEGEFEKEYLPTAIRLQVKIGAQIMMLNNDPDGRWVNGSIGEIRDIEHNQEGDPVIIAEIEDEIVEISRFTWEIYRFCVEEGALKSETIGTFTQFPLMLAWAITIHKSQGKTFEKAVIDIGRGTFAHGQIYVALSRCTSLEGIILKKPIFKKHIWTDYQVVDFLTGFQYKLAGESCTTEDKAAMIRKAIEENRLLTILYLKPNNEKDRRTVRPVELGDMEYRNKEYTGMRAFCYKRREMRTFRVDRILEIELAPSGEGEGRG